MDIKSKVDFHLEHLERLAPTLAETATSEKRSEVAWPVAVEYGFLRRYLDAAEAFEDPEDPAYVPDGSESRMEAIQTELERAELGRHLPTPDDLVKELEGLSRLVFEARVADVELTASDEAYPTELSGRADRPRQVIEEADEVLSVARTKSDFGSAIPADLFAQALRLARRLRDVLGPEVLDCVLQQTEAEAAERLVSLDDYGEFLWLGLRDPEMQVMLLREVGRRQEQETSTAPEPGESVVVSLDRFKSIQRPDEEDDEEVTGADSDDGVVVSLRRSTETPAERAAMAAFTGDSVPERAAEVDEWEGPGELYLLASGAEFLFLFASPEAETGPEPLNILWLEGLEGERHWLPVADADTSLWYSDEPIGGGESIRVEFSYSGSSIVIELPSGDDES